MTDLLPHRVTDADIARAFESKDFGRSDLKRELAMGVLKMALRYHCGHTITQIMMSLELIKHSGRVTEKGRRFCYETLNTDVSKLIEEARKEEREAGNWRPMATAPKDGTDILLVNFAGNVAAGAYLTSAISRRGAGWVLRGSYEPDVFFNVSYGPAGWMPLPDVSEVLTKEPSK